MATCPSRARFGGRAPGDVWGSVGSLWSVEPCSAQLAVLAFPGSVQAGRACWTVALAGRERPGSAMSPPPLSQIKNPFRHKGEVLLAGHGDIPGTWGTQQRLSAPWLLVTLGDTTQPLYPMRMRGPETAGHGSDLGHHSWVASPNTVSPQMSPQTVRRAESHTVMGHEFPSPRATSWGGSTLGHDGDGLGHNQGWMGCKKDGKGHD